MKIAILVPDGVGLRNYIYSDFLTHLKGNEITIIHKFPQAIVEHIQQIHADLDLKFVSFSPIIETRLCDTIRKVLNQAKLDLNYKVSKNDTLKKTWFDHYRSKSFKQKYYYQFINNISKIISTNNENYLKTEKLLFNLMNKSDFGKSCESILNQIEPDVILCTHQRSVEAGYFMTKANQLNIKTICVIFSWDNLPKSRNTFWADKYFVWSSLMKQDLMRFYPQIPEKDIFITGTPQFEFYSKASLDMSKDEFYQKYDLPTGRALICYSGNEPSVANDHLYLEDILSHLDKHDDDLNNKPFIIVRPAPSDHTDRLQKVVDKYPHLTKLIKPIWPLFGTDEWENYIPVFDDMILLNNIIKHSHSVINLGSTMGIDFSQQNKPALYINYVHPQQPHFDMVGCYNQEHFKTSIAQLDAVAFINSPSEFIDKIYLSIHQPLSIASQRSTWRKMVTDDINNASFRIADAMLHL